MCETKRKISMEILASLTICVGLGGSAGLATLQGFPVLFAGKRIKRFY